MERVALNHYLWFYPADGVAVDLCGTGKDVGVKHWIVGKSFQTGIDAERNVLLHFSVRTQLLLQMQ